ncbi:reverse transcriptase domain-containing protein [Tanacetum coccineum]|uniref:Reverse transcriptase domain-containing protein n=1 Tax=Tanacetum coccineum TaxID=301880 RepID=A0ABQ5GMF3_9ASTR
MSQGGGRVDEMIVRGGGRTRGRFGDRGNGGIDGQGGQVGGQGTEVNDGVDGVPDFSTIIAQHLQNLLPTILAHVGMSLRTTTVRDVPCNPKEYDGKGGAIVEEFCSSNEMQKLETELWNHAMVAAGHAAYTDRFHELARLVPLLVTPENKRIKRYIYGLASQIPGMVAATEPSTIQKAVKDRNGKEDNKRTRTENAFATTTNPVRRENAGAVPKCTTCNFHHPPEAPCRTCFNCNCPGHFAKDCRVVPRNVNPKNARNPTARACYECDSIDHNKAACPRLNQAQRPRENIQNQVVAVNGGQGHGNNCNQACGRVFMLGAEEAR